MSDEWRETTLGEVADITIGKTPPRGEPKYWSESLEFPFCTIADMTEWEISPTREGVSALAVQDKKAKKVPKGSLLMSFKLTLGRVGFAGRDIYPNEAIAWIEPKHAGLDKRYLAHWLSTQDLSTGSGRAVKGATLNGQSLRAIQVKVPPLPVQRRIVDLMTHIDAHIAKLQAECETAKTLRASALGDATKGALEVAPLNGEWSDARLGDVAEWRGGMTPSMANPTFWLEGEIPWISSKEVTGGILNATEKRVTKKAVQETSLSVVAPGSTVIVVRSGILAHTFPVAYVPFATTVNQDVKVAIPKDGVDGRFLSFLVEANAEEILERYRKTGTTVQSINVPALLDHPVRLPPIDLQCRIAALLEDLNRVVLSLTDEILAAEVARQALLTRLLDSSLLLNNAYDAFLDGVA